MSFEVLRFGKYDWYVLDKQDDRVLIITEKIIEKRPYHNTDCEITWETCDLRNYLNNEFYDSFDETDRAWIVETTNDNPDNPWDGTIGGSSTTNKIFLLSIHEVVAYFGDSGKLQTKQFGPKGEAWWFDDRYNADRAAKFGSKNAWWWLRSPGYISSRAAYISISGNVHIHGECTGGKGKGGGVRPALWLRTEESL
ncbi:MAG: DUF6273 domain-containing protein [Eubacteriales bacterium]|nr:DUF6273 domain-containing protein [Eubacteriales bacterium]